MKRIVLFFGMIILLLPAAFSINTATNISAYVGVEDFVPRIWLCDNRIVFDEAMEPGRISGEDEEMVERTQNYAFEGEQIQWDVLVMDKNGIQKVRDVYVLAQKQDEHYLALEANCIEKTSEKELDLESCNPRILEEEIKEFNEKTMRFYTCSLTVETPLEMYGEYFITVEAEDIDGLVGTLDEAEYWFLNPEVSLSITGAIHFEKTRPGTQSYSPEVIISNEAEHESGVQLDMFISGTDFYAISGRRGTCPDTNQLKLGDGESDCDPNDAFCYFSSNGNYDTASDLRSDSEGYVGINYGIGFNDPNPFYGGFNGDILGNEILQTPDITGPYFPGNILNPGSEMSLTFRLNLPNPCNGNFNTGKIFFWGEAI